MTKEEFESTVEKLFNDVRKKNKIIPKDDIMPYKLGFYQGVQWAHNWLKQFKNKDEITSDKKIIPSIRNINFNQSDNNPSN